MKERRKKERKKEKERKKKEEKKKKEEECCFVVMDPIDSLAASSLFSLTPPLGIIFRLSSVS